MTFELKNTIYDTVAHCIEIDQYIYIYTSHILITQSKKHSIYQSNFFIVMFI